MSKTDTQWQATVDIQKIDEEHRVAFGWMSVAMMKGQDLVDGEDDIIEMTSLEPAVYDYVLTSREAGDAHQEIQGIGQIVESIVFTDEKIKALAIDPLTHELNEPLYDMLLKEMPRGWWGGHYFASDAVWDKVKSGRYASFSIGGVAVGEIIDAT